LKQLEVCVPKLGMDTTEAVIGSWFVNEGDPVDIGTPLLELESEKVTFAVESEARGTISRILQPAGSTVPVGALVAILEIESI
jgi:pyruvate/2-oxoglutarate dehydrogenase complex dihydrolipoamide acyltransferase (E2) component